MRHRRIYDVLEEPRGTRYDELLAESLRHCARGLLVVRDECRQNAVGAAALDRLAPFVVDRRRSVEWPGTRLLGHEAEIATFALNDRSVAVLAELCRGLYEWLAPSRPEDLCLLRESGEAWLTSIAHERDSYLQLDDDEACALLDRCRFIALGDPREVQPETPPA